MVCVIPMFWTCNYIVCLVTATSLSLYLAAAFVALLLYLCLIQIKCVLLQFYSVWNNNIHCVITGYTRTVLLLVRPLAFPATSAQQGTVASNTDSLQNLQIKLTRREA